MKTESVITGKRRVRWVAAAGLASILLLLAFGMSGTLSARAPARGPHAATDTEEAVIPAVAWKPPDPVTIPHNQLGASIRLGRNIITDTPKYAAHYVGNKLNCADCHLDEGTKAYSSPLAGVTTVFPAYTRRDNRVISVGQRIQECFERSENGKPPSSDSPEMVAIVAYMNWLSKGIPMGSTVKGRGFVHLETPQHVDPAAGAKIYAQSCAACHQSNGAGIPGSFPALWGPDSFNDGAGMSRVAKMAAFVKANMPQNSPGSLSVQQAYDVAAYVDSKPRPHYYPRSH